MRSHDSSTKGRDQELFTRFDGIDKVDPSSPLLGRIKGLEYLRPKASPHPFVRIGGEFDGAYLIPQDLDGIEACYSPGVAQFKGFEDQLALDYGIRSFMCDYTTSPELLTTPLIPDMQFFEKKWLDIDGGDESWSLQEWIHTCSSPSQADLLLQMDIEGAEYRNLLATPTGTLARFRIIVLELHELTTEFASESRYQRRLGPLLHKLNRTHQVVHVHPNNCCGASPVGDTGVDVAHVMELTLLRADRFQRGDYQGTRVPHPLDIQRNVTSNPPIDLGPWWGGRAT